MRLCERFILLIKLSTFSTRCPPRLGYGCSEMAIANTTEEGLVIKTLESDTYIIVTDDEGQTTRVDKLEYTE